MILSDKEIRALSQKDKPLIHPFMDSQNKDIRPQGPSTGLTSYGYDLSLAPELHLFPRPKNDVFSGMFGDNIGKVIDPSEFKIAHDLQRVFPDEQGRLILPPLTFALGSVNEYIIMPDDLVAFMFPKSTYSRTGLQINAAPIEPGWEGEITLELFNSTGYPIALYANRGIVQAVFLRGPLPEKNYIERAGRYHRQRGITYPRG